MTDESELNVHETVAETPPAEAENPNPDDADADADLSRPARATQFRQQRRSQVSTAIPALLIIGLGALYLVNPPELTRPLAIGAGALAVGVSLVMRFLLNGRRERGLFFIGVIVMLLIGLIALATANNVDVGQVWPVGVGSVGLAMMLTFVFERTHDRGLLLPGIALIVAAGVALPFTMGMFSASILSGVALYWPLGFLLVALAILPRAIRDRAE